VAVTEQRITLQQTDIQHTSKRYRDTECLFVLKAKVKAEVHDVKTYKKIKVQLMCG